MRRSERWYPSRGFTERDTPTSALDTDASFDLLLGNRGDLSRTFDGVLDELRLSSVNRSAGWIATEHANQASPATFLTISAPL